MATWRQFEEQAPELAAMVRERFEAHKHLTMATLRADGSPRISGTEVPITGGELYLGGMTGNRRFADLRRDPRVAIHSGSDDPDHWSGDAKVAGRAVELVEVADRDRFRDAVRSGGGEAPDDDFELFRLDLTEASVVRLSEAKDHLLVDTWREGAGITTVERR